MSKEELIIAFLGDAYTQALINLAIISGFAVDFGGNTSQTPEHVAHHYATAALNDLGVSKTIDEYKEWTNNFIVHSTLGY